MKCEVRHNWDMGMEPVWLNGRAFTWVGQSLQVSVLFGRMLKKMLVFRGVPFLIITWPQVSVPLNSRPVAYYREGGTTPHLRLVFRLHYHEFFFSLLQSLCTTLRNSLWTNSMWIVQGWAVSLVDNRSMHLMWEVLHSLRTPFDQTAEEWPGEQVMWKQSASRTHKI